MRIFYSESFKRDFQDLPKEIKKIVEQKLTLFVKNLHHPSLRIKKMAGLKNIWEGSITKSYRFTFSNCILLLNSQYHGIMN